MLHRAPIASALAVPMSVRIPMLAIFLLGNLLCSGGPVAAQTPSNGDAANYPDRAIHIIVPFAPVGASDVLARVVGEKVSEDWKQPVVIENRAGAGGNLGAKEAARATPDGYTLLLVSDTLLSGLNYNIVHDFAPITLGTVTPMVVVVPPTSPVNSVRELLALAKKQRLFWGSGGPGSSVEVAGLVFAAMTHVHIEEVSYRSIPPVVPDLLAGRLSLSFLPVQLAAPLVSSGKLKALALTSSTRSPAWPDLPTVAEAGVPGYEHVTWGGFLAPPGTPAPIISKLNTEMVKVLNLPDVRAKLTGQGARIVANSPDEFKNFLAKQHELIAKFGLKLN